MTLRQVSAGDSASEAPMLRAEAARLRLLSGTIFGRAVVPEVCSTSAMSSGSAGPGRAGRRRRERGGVEAEQAGGGLRMDQAEDGNAEPGGDDARRALVAVGQDQGGRLQVGEVELELLGLVGRVERRGGAAGGDGDEAGRHLRPVRQHDRDPVAAPDADAVQRLAHLDGQPRQGGAVEPVAARGADAFAPLVRRQDVPNRACHSLDPLLAAHPMQMAGTSRFGERRLP